jgi:hypothetical protein
MSILNMSATFFGAHSWWSRWNDLKRYVVECRHRIRSRYELEALNERRPRGYGNDALGRPQ